MALKLPWKYKSPVAGQNGGPGGWGVGRNNLVVTGWFESFYPVMFLVASSSAAMPQFFSPLLSPLSSLSLYPVLLPASLHLSKAAVVIRWRRSAANAYFLDISGSSGSSVCPGNRGDGESVRLSLCWGCWPCHLSPAHCHHFIFLTHSSSPLVSLFTGVPVSWSRLRTSRVHGGDVQLHLLNWSVFFTFLSLLCWPPPFFNFSVPPIDRRFNSGSLSLFGRIFVFPSGPVRNTLGPSNGLHKSESSEVLSMGGRQSPGAPRPSQKYTDSRQDVGTTDAPPAGCWSDSDPSEGVRVKSLRSGKGHGWKWEVEDNPAVYLHAAVREEAAVVWLR